MMDCKYCGQPLDSGEKFCPHCGRDLTQETEQPAVAQAQAAAEAAADSETAEAAEAAAAQEETASEEAAAPAEPEKKKNGTLIGVVAGIIAVVAVLLILLVPRLKSDRPEVQPEEPSASDTADSTDDADDADDAADAAAEPTVSYSVTADELTDEVLSRVVATCGDEQLTNRGLAYYYWNQYYSFANTYGMYLAYLLDTTQPLEAQMYDGENTWQQMFLNSGVDMFRSLSALEQQANANGFTLSAAREEELASLSDLCAQGAEVYGFADGDAYIQSVFGPSATVEDYVAFCRKLLLTTDYLQSLVDAHEYTDADIEAYYDAHAEDYVNARVEKIDKPMVTIRHILIQPEGEQDENGSYSDEAWAAAEQKANEVLQEWESGEMTEERFGELAAEYSADGNASSGGIYEDVYPGQMVDSFNDWCFDDARTAGDYGLVKTEFGYHIIYFSAVSDAVYWRETATSDYLQELANTLEAEAADSFDFTSDLTQAAVFDVLADQRAQQAAAQAAQEAAAAAQDAAADTEAAPEK